MVTYVIVIKNVILLLMMNVVMILDRLDVLVSLLKWPWLYNITGGCHIQGSGHYCSCYALYAHFFKIHRGGVVLVTAVMGSKSRANSFGSSFSFMEL